MTDRKNVTLPEPYEGMFRDLKARGEFDRAFGGFSQFVQYMIEEFHDNPEKVRAEYHKKQEKRHKKLRENFEDEADVELDDDSDQFRETETEFFQSFLELLQEKKGSRDWHKNAMSVYTKLENGWMRKYQSDFTSITQDNFRQRFKDVVGADAIEDLGLDPDDF